MTTERCTHCQGRGKAAFDTPFTMAFQPIYDLDAGAIYAHEALLRSAEGGSAAEVLAQVTEENRYAYDQACRVKAIELAARLGIQERLSINVLPNAVYDPDTCIQRTLWAADRWEFPIESLVFEFTEGEQITDLAHLKHIIDRYQARGFLTAFDDFGAGYAGLGLLAQLQPDIIKIDRALVTGIDADPVRQNILTNIMTLCDSLGIRVIAEGIETEAELRFLAGCGVRLVQGYLLARPQLAELVPAATIRQTLAPLDLAG